MRIGVVLEQLLSPVPGGTGRYAHEIATALAASPRGAVVSGWSAWHRDVAAARVPGVDGPHRLALPRRPLVVAWERGRGPRPRGVDVVHAPTLLFPPRGRRPLVVTVHDAVPWTHPETLTPRGVRWHRAMAERAAEVADAVVVPTRAVEAALGRVTGLRRMVVVGEGVSGRLALPEDHEERSRRLGLPDRYLLSLATLEPRKGLDVLVAALGDPRAPEMPLVVVGQPGWGGVDMESIAGAHGLPSDRLLVLGRVSDPDLAVVLHRAHALAVPSRAEGFGLPVLEAMAAGVPVVSSDDPALAEVGGDATLRSPIGDPGALAEALACLEDPATRARLVVRGTARASGYTWAVAAAKLTELYERVLS